MFDFILVTDKYSAYEIWQRLTTGKANRKAHPDSNLNSKLKNKTFLDKMVQLVKDAT